MPGTQIVLQLENFLRHAVAELAFAAPPMPMRDYRHHTRRWYRDADVPWKHGGGGKEGGGPPRNSRKEAEKVVTDAFASTKCDNLSSKSEKMTKRGGPDTRLVVE